MIRVLAPRPQVYDLPRLHAEARAAGAGCLAVNEVGDQIAAYWDDDASALTGEEWAAVVAAHVPPVAVEPVVDDPVAAAVTIVREEVSARLDSSVTSIAKLKTAFIEGLNAAAVRAGS